FVVTACASDIGARLKALTARPVVTKVVVIFLRRERERERERERTKWLPLVVCLYGISRLLR
uniref:hypothetical protein n=1 Tax=Rothia nasimurium TaxID=85336 RepID=UPI001F26591A